MFGLRMMLNSGIVSRVRQAATVTLHLVQSFGREATCALKVTTVPTAQSTTASIHVHAEPSMISLVGLFYCLLGVHKSITNMQRGARVNKNNGHSPYH